MSPESSAPRILMLTSTYPRWAGDVLPRFVHDLAAEMVRQGARVTVIAPMSNRAVRREVMDGVEVVRYRFWPFRGSLLSDVAKLPAIRRNPLNLLQAPCMVLGCWHALHWEGRRFRPDAVHAHWLIPQGLLAVLERRVFRMRARVVITCHGADVFGLRRLRRLKRWVADRADACAGVSQAIVRELRDGVGVRESLPTPCLSMGVDTRRFHPDRADDAARARWQTSGPRLLFVGRLTEKKGVRVLLEAMVRVRAEAPDAVLLMAGYGEQEAALKQQAEVLGLLDRAVLFLGRVSHEEAPGLYASADVFAGPSIVAADGDTEGLGLVFVEAQASGCAVVASDLPAIRDVVAHGETGLLARAGDADDLAARLLEVIRDPGLRGRLAVRGREAAVARFDWSGVARRYLDLLGDGS